MTPKSFSGLVELVGSSLRGFTAPPDFDLIEETAIELMRTPGAPALGKSWRKFLKTELDRAAARALKNAR